VTDGNNGPKVFGYDSAKQRSSPQYGSESGEHESTPVVKYGEVIINESYKQIAQASDFIMCNFTPVRELTIQPMQ